MLVTPEVAAIVNSPGASNLDDVEVDDLEPSQKEVCLACRVLPYVRPLESLTWCEQSLGALEALQLLPVKLSRRCFAESLADQQALSVVRQHVQELASLQRVWNACGNDLRWACSI